MVWDCGRVVLVVERGRVGRVEVGGVVGGVWEVVSWGVVSEGMVRILALDVGGGWVGVRLGGE